jgi:type I restriction enzyme S subunit
VPGKVDDVFRCIEKERQTTARTPREFVPLSSLLGEPEGERTIPSHWSWAYFGDVHLGITSGWSPQCEDRQREGDEWGVLKVSAVSWNRFLPEQNKALPANLEPRPQHEVRVGDFLMSRANTADLVGKSIVVHDTPPHLMLSDKLLRVTLPRSYLPKFANLVNNSSLGRGHYETEASGTSASMKNISREQINRLVVPIAPLEEQRRIVTKVDHLMALCNELERAITKKGATSERYASAAVLAMMNEEGRRDRT